MKTLLRYDFLYMKKTSKILVFVILGIFLSGLSVLTARYMNELLALAFAQEGMGDITLPEVTVMDAYVQFYSNFQQIFFFAIIFIGIAFINQDMNKGYDIWLFSRPVKRYQYLLSKTIILNSLVFASLLISAVFFGYYTFIVFETFDILRFGLGLLLFMVFIKMFIQLLMLLVVIFEQILLPAVIAITVFFILTGITVIEWAIFKYLPGHLLSFPLTVMEGDILWKPIIYAVLIATILGFIFHIFAVKVFEKKQLS